MTTTMVSLDGLRELAAFRAENGCAISLYLDLDPSRVPTAGDTATRVHSLLDLAAKSHGATRPDLAHEVRSGLKADFERLEQFFDGEFDRDGAHGLAVFAAGLGQRLERPRRCRRRARHGARRRRLPAGAARPAARARATARSSPSSAASRAACWRSGTAGWSRSPTGPRRRRAGTTRAAGRRPASSGTSRTSRTSTTGRSPRSSSALPPARPAAHRRRLRRGDAAPSSRRRSRREVADAVIGWTTAEAHASDSDLYDVVVPVARAVARRPRERRDRALARGDRARRARGASGWADTLEAASDGRVELLLYAEGVQKDAFRCPACGRAALDASTLPARRHDDGGARRRARPRCPPDARARRRRARGRAPPADLDPRRAGIGAISALLGASATGPRARVVGGVDRAELLAELGRLHGCGCSTTGASSGSALSETTYPSSLRAVGSSRFSSEPTVSLNAPTAPLRLFPILARWPPTIPTRS